VLPEIKCLELSLDQGLLLIGGGRDDDDGVARLLVIAFDESFKLFESQTIGPQSMNCVYSLTRMPFENVFFAGGYGSVSSFYLDEKTKKISSLRDFEDIMSGEILDLKFEKEVLYVLSPTQEDIARLNFSKTKTGVQESQERSKS